jgi:hypothetical protein
MLPISGTTVDIADYIRLCGEVALHISQAFHNAMCQQCLHASCKAQLEQRIPITFGDLPKMYHLNENINHTGQ